MSEPKVTYYPVQGDYLTFTVVDAQAQQMDVKVEGKGYSTTDPLILPRLAEYVALGLLTTKKGD